MSNILTGKELAEFAISKVGTPYVYGAKGARGVFTADRYNFLRTNYPKVFTSDYNRKIFNMDVIDKKICTDCSGLISWYTGKELGSAQLYSKAYTRLPISNLRDFAVGTVLYKSGHVGIYIGNDDEGNPLCIEAKGIDYGTVIGIVSNPSRWTCGLTFNWMDYDIDKPIKDKTWKEANPYNEPTRNLKKGDKGDDVRWLQYELIEAGYGRPFVYNKIIYRKVVIDGDFGRITDAATRLFQTSSKIKVDGICGPITRKQLSLN